MIAQAIDFSSTDVAAWEPSQVAASHHAPHVLLVAGNQRARYTLADTLLTAGCRLTLCSTYGVADLLLESTAAFDLLIAAQPVEDWSGMARLARSANAELPIVMLEEDTVAGSGVLAAVQSAIERWPATV